MLRLAELRELTVQYALAELEFASFWQEIASSDTSIDNYSVEEKHSLRRTIVKKVVWGGENASVCSQKTGKWTLME